MKIVRFKDAEQKVQFGHMDGFAIQPIKDLKNEFWSSRQIIHRLNDLGSAEFITQYVGNQSVKLHDVRLLSPISSPEKLFCIGRNYDEHALETNSTVGEIPVVFNKFPSAIIGPDQPIVIPKLSSQVDYEAELVVVIGKPGKDISQENARAHVFGYCCGNDISARDWQKGKPGGQWLLGKTFDTFAPLGPAIVSADEIQDPQSLDIQLTLNGQIMQKANTEQMVFTVDFLVSHLSRFCELSMGDLIFTGTPSGVGMARDPQVFLKPGDRVEVEIEGVGKLSNPVV